MATAGYKSSWEMQPIAGKLARQNLTDMGLERVACLACVNVIHTLLMRKLSYRIVKKLAQDYMANKWSCWEPAAFLFPISLTLNDYFHYS